MDRVKEGVIGKYMVPGVNGNGERIYGICALSGYSVGNAYF